MEKQNPYDSSQTASSQPSVGSDSRLFNGSEPACAQDTDAQISSYSAPGLLRNPSHPQSVVPPPLLEPSRSRSGGSSTTVFGPPMHTGHPLNPERNMDLQEPLTATTNSNSNSFEYYAESASVPNSRLVAVNVEPELKQPDGPSQQPHALCSFFNNCDDTQTLFLKISAKMRRRRKRLKHQEVPGTAIGFVPEELLMVPPLLKKRKKIVKKKKKVIVETPTPTSEGKGVTTAEVGSVAATETEIPEKKKGKKRKKKVASKQEMRTPPEGETATISTSRGEGGEAEPPKKVKKVRKARRRFIPLIAPGIPVVSTMNRTQVVRLEKKGISILNFVWAKQMQVLRKNKDAINSIKLFKYNVGQGLMPDAAIVATLFSSIDVAADTLAPGEARELADFVRRVNPGVSENSLFCMLRLYCLERTQEGFDIAMQILQEIKQKFSALLRDYSPLFSALRELKTPAHLDQAFALLAEVKSTKYDTLESHFLDTLALATELHINPPDRIYSMLLDFNEVIFRPSKLMLTALENWFIFQSEGTDCHAPSRGVVGANGICTCCYRMLKSIDLTDAEFGVMLGQINTLLEQAGTNNSGKLRPRPVYNTAEDRLSPFQNFQNWLRVNGPFDVVIDGANVGYYQWRPRDGDDILNFQQIHSIYDYWRREGKRVLVVLHERHVESNKMQRMAKYHFQGIVQRWGESRSLYLTPKGSNDDWYWLYAGLAGTRHNRRMFLVTNDQMRDHHFATLSTRHFVKWRGRHMVTYTFEGRHPVFRPPAVISYQSQLDCNERYSYWHFPMSPPIIVQPRGNRVAPEPYSTASTAAVALTSSLSAEDPEDLETVEWLCAQNLTTVFAPSE